MHFQLQHEDAESSARAGQLSLRHGTVETPCFMPVGTQGTVKTLSPEDLKALQAKIILGNTYHLYLRPGLEVIEKAGGLHRFMGWDLPILTDSGGYQVFSQADLNTIEEGGVQFQSHLDGSYHELTPAKVIDIQMILGSDIIMPLDYPVEYPATLATTHYALKLTHQWESKCKFHFEHHRNPNAGQFLYGITQGGFDQALRRQSLEQLCTLNFDGYAIGGLSVGEPKNMLYELTEYSTRLLPKEKPRYLMGVGKPEDLITAIALGVDMFDCVIPTRNGRNGTVYTYRGKLVVKNAQYKNDFTPVDEGCNCYLCRNFTRAYLRHLFNAGEILALRLASLHNVHFFVHLVHEARQAILDDRFNQWKRDFFSAYRMDKGEENE